MSTRKQRRKETREGGSPASEATPAPAAHPRKHAAAPPPEAPADPEAEWRAQRVLAVIGFALVGLLMGFLTGANRPIEVADAGFALGQAVRVGTAIAGHSAAWLPGFSAGLAGLAVGACFGYSLFLAPAVMLLTLAGGGVGLALGLASGIPLVGGAGWLGGYLAVLFTALKVRLGAS